MQSYAENHWVAPKSGAVEIASAVEGRVVATASSEGVDFGAMVRHARKVGGPALRALTFHQRAEMLKRIATHLTERKEALYELSYDTGSTRRDSWIDIDGGIGTLFAYASRGKRDLPSERFVMDGAFEPLSKHGTFVGAHIMTPLHGVAVHVNAYNFPCWGMLEKMAPTVTEGPHPFKRDYDTLRIGDTVETGSRTITLDDIEYFENFTSDTFYAHMDEEAAKANPFFPGRVAHGYLILPFAAGLFVDPAPGPLLANYGLERLRFLKPVSPGASIRVRLTVKQKRAARLPDYGEVRWDAEVFNQGGETVAQYDVLTMSARPAA